MCAPDPIRFASVAFSAPAGSVSENSLEEGGRIGYRSGQPHHLAQQ
jgi:hypothetical protein